jgi:ketosteroid isomerase-like protein
MIRRYWDIIQRDQVYSETLEFYLPDSVLVDPVYGPFEGYEAIKGFLEQVTADMRELNITFTVDDVAGEGDVGWSRWSFHLPDGTVKKGVSIYRFKGDGIFRQYDYIGTDQL